MAIYRSFKAFRPEKSKQELIPALPYDVMNSDEARKAVEGNPYSFLHIDKAEIDLPLGTEPYSKEVYEKACENLENLEKTGALIQDCKPCFYIYRQVMNGRSQTGIVGCASIDDYMNNIINQKLLENVIEKLKKINIDGILDSGYLKKYLVEKNSLFPTIQTTERPDLVAMALLEGKCIIIVDNSPYVLITPCFFIDLFHTPDDYYQKTVNTTFIRIIRILAFLIAIFIPAYYIAITTHNHDSVTTDLLLNFLAQRRTVPFPALVEGLIMTISFEILRESDMRMASTMGTAVSILGGLVLGDAAVTAGIISPIMIIVVAISAISGLAFTSIELTSAIRFYRILFMILAASLGFYGIFLGFILLVAKLASITSFDIPYLAPFAPLIKEEQKDAILKINNGNKLKRRNPLLTTKNKIRGR